MVSRSVGRWRLVALKLPRLHQKVWGSQLLHSGKLQIKSQPDWRTFLERAPKYLIGFFKGTKGDFGNWCLEQFRFYLPSREAPKSGASTSQCFVPTLPACVNHSVDSKVDRACSFSELPASPAKPQQSWPRCATARVGEGQSSKWAQALDGPRLTVPCGEKPIVIMNGFVTTHVAVPKLV